MLSFFRTDPVADAALALYRAIVAQSRHPHFYAELGIADTPRGRFMAISLHMALVLRRLKQAPEASALAQKLFDSFFRDMDRSLREMGISDLAIGKRVGETFKLTSINYKGIDLEFEIVGNLPEGRYDSSAIMNALYFKEALNKLAPKLTDETMRRLNNEVDGNKKEPAAVAKTFLQEQGLIKK